MYATSLQLNLCVDSLVQGIEVMPCLWIEIIFFGCRAGLESNVERVDSRKKGAVEEGQKPWRESYW